MNTTELADIQAHLSGIEAGDGRSASLQAGYQLIALLVTLVIAIATGAITGKRNFKFNVFISLEVKVCHFGCTHGHEVIHSLK